MKRTLLSMIALFLTIAAGAQTLNIRVGSVTYQFPAAQAGEMTYNSGQTLTVMGKTFTLSQVDEMTVDGSSVKDNTVTVAYNGTGASVCVAGNVAQYVGPTVGGAHVSIDQTNTAAGLRRELSRTWMAMRFPTRSAALRQTASSHSQVPINVR